MKEEINITAQTKQPEDKSNSGRVVSYVAPVFDNRKLFDKEKTDKCAKSIEWETPPEVFEPLDAEFHFNLDVCATLDNKKCDEYFDKNINGLKQDWWGVCWMNPPFGRTVKDWIAKALSEAKKGNATTVCLIPAKTNTNWWHDLVIPNAEIRWVRGRIKFIKDGKQTTQALPWPMAILVFRAST